VFDASGRQVWGIDISGFGAGQHLMTIGDGRLSSGIYLIRLEQSGRFASARAVIVH
jgi:hypothetical protein